MKITIKILFALLVLWQNAEAQGFVNLDFESATLFPVPSGQFGGEVSSTNAIPGWTGSLGTIQVTQVLQNNFTLGNASIDILGPNWSFAGIIEGQYTLVLQPGFDPFGSGHDVSASISQTGLVPADARSIQFHQFRQFLLSATAFLAIKPNRLTDELPVSQNWLSLFSRIRHNP